MLKSYEALYENGQIKWLREQPDVPSAHLIVTVLEDSWQSKALLDKVIKKGGDNLAANIEGRFADLGDFELPEIPREAIKMTSEFTER
jgi:hypothetical protein